MKKLQWVTEAWVGPTSITLLLGYTNADCGTKSPAVTLHPEIANREDNASTARIHLYATLCGIADSLKNACEKICPGGLSKCPSKTEKLSKSRTRSHLHARQLDRSRLFEIRRWFPKRSEELREGDGGRA